MSQSQKTPVRVEKEVEEDDETRWVAFCTRDAADVYKQMRDSAEALLEYADSHMKALNSRSSEEEKRWNEFCKKDAADVYKQHHDTAAAIMDYVESSMQVRLMRELKDVHQALKENADTIEALEERVYELESDTGTPVGAPAATASCKRKTPPPSSPSDDAATPSLPKKARGEEGEGDVH